MTRTCSNCSDPQPLGRRNKSGLCRPCIARRNFADPECKARAKAGIRRFFADPVNRAALAARSQAQLEAWRETAEGAETLRRIARDHLKLGNTEQAEIKRVRSIRAKVWAGIPESRWDEASNLSKCFGAAEARRIIREDEAKIERARLASMTPFERQMERVRNGARVVDKVDTRRADHDFTLGGIATGML